MQTTDGLLDVLQRTHRSLSKLIDHCRELNAEELNQELEGFGYPTVRLQLHHVLGAQRYWVGVLEGRLDVDEDEDEFLTLDAMEELRRDVCLQTERFLGSTSDEDLNSPRSVVTWRGDQNDLIPARVILRTLTHSFQHQGQIAAQCRLMGKPIPPGLDYPLL